MASKMLLVGIMAAALICGMASARTLSPSMDNMMMKKSESKSEPDMKKTFFHPFIPPYGLIGHGWPYLGDGILKGGGLGAGLGEGGFGGGLNGGLGNGGGDVLGGRKDEHNGGDQNNNNGGVAASGADQGITP